jgi:hypothetical protein
MTVDMHVSAERYLELVHTFGSGSSTWIDDSIIIPVQIVSVDTNGNEVIDTFEVIIEGSDQDYSTVCDWEILSLQGLMADNWIYEIGDPDLVPVYMDIPVTTYLDGIYQLSDECQKQIYMSLDVEIVEGVWLEIWSNKEETPDIAGYIDYTDTDNAAGYMDAITAYTDYGASSDKMDDM